MSVHICGIAALRSSCFSDVVVRFCKFTRKACIYSRFTFPVRSGLIICVAVCVACICMRRVGFRFAKRAKAENVVKRLEIVVGCDLFKL